MALGLIHVRGRLCKYESKSKGNRRAGSKAGKFVACRPAGKRGYVVDKRSPSKRRASSSSAKATPSKPTNGCVKKRVSIYGNRVCREICYSNGKKVSSTPASGCGTLRGVRSRKRRR